MHLITAKFIGKNSLGYETGKTYKLIIVGNTVKRLDGSSECPYESIAAFVKNWTNII
jgi:hypothetical protein